MGFDARAFDARTIATLAADELLLKRRRIMRELRAVSGPRRPLRIAVLGGTTTHELVDMLEVLLLLNGFDPVFYQSDYGRYEEDVLLDSARLVEFKPELVYIHTSCKNVHAFPAAPAIEEEHQRYVQQEVERFRRIWRGVHEQLGCVVIQNNFELPSYALLGNMDAVVSGGRTRFLMDLNTAFAAEARGNSRLLIQDLHSIAAHVGLERWFDPKRWHSYKMLYTPEGSLALARSLNAVILSVYGQARKVLVLDLDNTLWGGVIGDDGVEKIAIGRETPSAEAYTAFQEYCLEQRSRGVLLAVCSKNELTVAQSGFSHPDSVLKLHHFSAFKADWEPKHENLLEIAKELDLSLDSFVFVDDNPAERHIVASQAPGVAVPDMGDDVSSFITTLEAGRYFEPVTLSQEDFKRPEMYAGRAEQTLCAGKFADYGEYLDSLQMVAEMDAFQPVYLQRIAQLTNKTNQFNLTTRRYTLPEMEAFAADPNYVTLYGRLKDRFCDHGLVSVVVGRREGHSLHLDLWLMSCRVLKRQMELAMLDALATRARAAGMCCLVGYYIPSRKNGVVAGHYQSLGFMQIQEHANGTAVWTLDLEGYTLRNHHIQIAGG